MPRQDPGPSVKDQDMYGALRDEGNSKAKSARIANAAANTSRAAVGRKGGRAGDYDDWTRKRLLQRARTLGVTGLSTMSKTQLIAALRHH